MDLSLHWKALPEDLQNKVLAELSYLDIARIRSVCRDFRDLVKKKSFQTSWAASDRVRVSLCPLIFFTGDDSLEWIGFDSTLRQWRRLPSLGSLLPPCPSSRASLLKDYMVTVGGGLLCIDVSESSDMERIIVCHPVARTARQLPPLHFRRQPVLMHLLVDLKTKTYQVIVAGSASVNSGILSLKTEVYQSATGKWESKGDVPGPEYGLNQYQSGAFLNGVLFCLAVKDGRRNNHVVLAYHVEKGEWLSNWKCPFPSSYYEDSVGTNPQLVRCGEKIFLFWEHARDWQQTTSFCFASLKFEPGDEEGGWLDVTVQTRKGCIGLITHPEYTCSPDANKRLHVLNSILYTAEVYDLESGKEQKLPDPPPCKENWEIFYTLNPINFSFEPDLSVNV